MERPQPQRTAQFNIKLRPRELETIRQAACASGRYVTEMFRDSALRRARRVLRENENDA